MVHMVEFQVRKEEQGQAEDVLGDFALQIPPCLWPPSSSSTLSTKKFDAISSK